MITKIIIDRLEALERDNALLKSKIRLLNKNKQVSRDDILKLICDKIPKQDKDKLTKNDVIEILNKYITVDFINKRYGK